MKMKLKTKKESNFLNKLSLKKEKVEENIRIVTIEERFNFIKLIIDNKYAISFDNKKNPFIIKHNNISNSTKYPEVLVNNPNDILKYFSKKSNQKKILADKYGNLDNLNGIPYLICKGSCNSIITNKNNFKLGLKIILFNIEDLETVKNKKEIKEFIKKSLKKLKEQKEKEEEEKEQEEEKKKEEEKKYNENKSQIAYKSSLINKMNYKELTYLYENIDKFNEKQLYELYGILDYNLNQNTELRIIKLLSGLVLDKRTPHINLSILEFQTTMNDFFKKKYLSLQEISTIFHSQKSLLNTNLINVLISEWCSGGNLEAFLIKNKTIFNKEEINLDVLFFQILSLLTTILIYYPNFKHNDLHLGNLLVQTNKKTNKYFLYKMKNILEKDTYTNYIIPDVGFQIRLWDYDLSSIEGIIDNNFINDEFEDNCFILSKKNQFVDLVKFAYMYQEYIIKESILKNDKYNDLILKDILGNLNYNTDTKLSKKNNKLVDNINSAGCLLKDVEYTTPIILLKNYSLKFEYFGKFICKEEDLKNYSIIETYIVD